jgi:hypothetical protein
MSPEPPVVASRDQAASPAHAADDASTTGPSILEKIFVWVAVGFVVITSVWIAIRLITRA